MNLAIDECVEMAASGQQNDIAMEVIQGNSTIMLEAVGPAHTMALISRAPALL